MHFSAAGRITMCNCVGEVLEGVVEVGEVIPISSDNPSDFNTYFTLIWPQDLDA
jgi:hypothetical protein